MNRSGFQLRNFSAGNPDLFAKLVIGWLAAELLAHVQRDAAHLCDFFAEMNRQSDGLALSREGALDRLPDPPGGISTELCAFRRIEPIDRRHQSDISFGDNVKNRQTEIRIVLCDRHDE